MKILTAFAVTYLAVQRFSAQTLLKSRNETHNFIHQNLVAQTQNSLNQEIKTNTNDIQTTHNITMQQVLFRQRRQTGHIDQHLS